MYLNFQEISYLLKIREYIYSCIGNPRIEPKTVNYLNNCLLMIDKKIIGMLTAEDFKAYIDYDKCSEEILKLNKLKSGFP